jgi:hypothetical protein
MMNISKPVTDNTVWAVVHTHSYEIQSGLLVLTTVAAIIASIPPLRLAGSLALRSISLLSSGTNIATTWENRKVIGKIASIAKVAVVASGIIALVISSPMLMVASITADTAIQLVQLIEALYLKKYNTAWRHAVVIFLNTFSLAAIITGSWQLMVTAIVITSVAMLVVVMIQSHVAIMSNDRFTSSEKISMGCYIILSIVGMVNGATTAKLMDVKCKYSYKIDNKKEYKKPADWFDRHTPERKIKTFKIEEEESFIYVTDQMRKVRIEGPNGAFFVEPYHTEAIDVLVQRPLEPHLFPTVPLGSGSIVTRDIF